MLLYIHVQNLFLAQDIERKRNCDVNQGLIPLKLLSNNPKLGTCISVLFQILVNFKDTYIDLKLCLNFAKKKVKITSKILSMLMCILSHSVNSFNILNRNHSLVEEHGESSIALLF